MTDINQSTANWRLFGGGGLALGGFLYALTYILVRDGSYETSWLGVISLAIAGVGFFFVAYGQSGSNGAVGASPTGKLALYATAALFLLDALLRILAQDGSDIDSKIFDIHQLATVAALSWAAYEVSKRGVTEGNASIALFGVASWAALVQILNWAGGYGWWQAFALGLSILATGILYVLND
ncbi:hypothetical protein [Aeromicrobium sp.]|uniref:hypothetical protein n=1 Tax=Aeromicrobium sp. TaxID=1871063 RepID=UPI002FC81179